MKYLALHPHHNPKINPRIEAKVPNLFARKSPIYQGLSGTYGQELKYFRARIRRFEAAKANRWPCPGTG